MKRIFYETQWVFLDCVDDGEDAVAPYSLQNGFVKKKWNNTDMYDALLVLPHFFTASRHNDFSEGVAAVPEWQQFLLSFFRRGDG